ncbi:MAG: TM2 domain-containing protein [Rhodothermales bacterium]|nr:TM2 domain-containing protein [Rhodothermales bacterium]
MSEAISKAITHLPEVDDEELLHVASLMKNMGDEQARQFAAVYKKRRRDATVSLLLAAAGFLGIAGIHRFYLDQVGMGILYLLTGGLCFIGTIVDMFNHATLTLEHNKRKADSVAVMIRTAIDEDAPRSLPPAL